MNGTFGTTFPYVPMWATDAYVVKSADLGELKATIREILKEVEFQHNLYNKRTQQETLALTLL